MVVALLVHALGRQVDAMLGWTAVIGVEGARAVLAALASSMLTFIVFVFSILLLAVQLASAQLTPRIIATFFRNRVLRFSLTVFVFAFTYTLGVLSRIDESVPQISLWVAVYSSVACIGVFLYLIDNVGKSLRPVSILTECRQQGAGGHPGRLPAACRGNGGHADQRRAGARGRAVARRRDQTHRRRAGVRRGGPCGAGPARRLPDRIGAAGRRFRDRRGPAVPAVRRRQVHRRSPTGPGRRHRAGAHDGAGPGIRVPHHRRHRLARRCRRRSTIRPPRCSRSTRSIACCARSAAGNWTPGGSTTTPGSCASPIARRTGKISSAWQSPRSGSSAGAASRSPAACGPCWRT